MAKSSLGREVFISLSVPRLQRLGGRRVLLDWLAPHGWLNLLTYRAQDHQPRDDPALNGLGPPPLITN